MTREEAHKLVDMLFDEMETTMIPHISTATELNAVQEERKLPEGKRAVRTKTSGDRVYLLDEVEKTRQWITNGDILEKLGFTQADVTEVDDNVMMTYKMGPAIFKVEESTTDEPS